MINLNEVANMDWNGGMVSPTGTFVGSRFVNWLTSVIHRMWDAVNLSVGELEGDDEDSYPTGGCCCY